MKTFIADIVTVGIAVAVFLILKPEGPVPVIITAAMAVAAHIAAEKLLGGEEDGQASAGEEKKKTDLTPELQEAIVDLHEEFCTGNSRDYAAGIASGAVDSFSEIIGKFRKRKKALYKVIALTEHKNAPYIERGSDVAEQIFINLAEILRIKLTILVAIDPYDYQYDSVKSDIETVIKRTEQRLSEYSELLTQAGKLNDGDIGAEDEIIHIVDRLKTAIEEDSREFQQSSEPGVTAGGRNYGI